MKKTSRWKARTVLAALFAVTAPLALAAAPASAAESQVGYLCQAYREGAWMSYSSTRTWDVVAPATVSAGAPFDVSYELSSFTLNPEYQQEVREITVGVTLPEGSELVDVALSGGSNLGDSQQTVEVEDDTAYITASGPFFGGQTFQLPVITATVTAPESGVLTTEAAGTDFGDPGLALRSLDPTTSEFNPTQCYPDPATPVTLSSTTVQP
ncbi:hypothetical protein [Streptomyces sp. NL15-2K]|uniref:hypothetical protein n=1 Tax=Streptomyces sp. NL15-2K TaxID=376149 RepID=UPI000F560129|nr:MULTISPECIES: hypothetical protein [Actinomycetes]WKX10988.1 hypothetical protein Q4V64_27160 [Kutzneria buriramensis]GCB46920.1 hypothetical protein SNL152K_4222 [Streptomyces sp. NL15-2K]